MENIYILWSYLSFMVEKIFECVICHEHTIAPRAHIPTHTLEQITETFIELTKKNEVKDKKSLKDWNLHI